MVDSYNRKGQSGMKPQEAIRIMKIAIMQESLHKLMGEDYSNCSGTAHKNGYMAFYHQRGLYSVEHEDSEIVSLVYARNPFEAIDLVDEFRRMAGEQECIH